MPGLPTSPAPARITLSHNRVTLASVAQGGKRWTRSIPYSMRWRAQLEWDQWDRANLAPVVAAVHELGTDTAFFWVPPGRLPRGAWTGGAPLVNAAVTQGANTVAIKGLTASQAVAVAAGDFIRFASHAKVYEAAADAASNGSGIATVTLTCGVFQALAGNEAIDWNGVPFKMVVSEPYPGVVFDYTGGNTLRVNLLEDHY
jgi:hypothetical protein